MLSQGHSHTPSATSCHGEQVPARIFKHKVFLHVFWARSTQNALMSCSVNKETMATHTELPRELLKQGLIVNKQPDDVRFIY